MLFKVEMTVIPPAHLSEEEFNAIKLKEKNYADVKYWPIEVGDNMVT